MSAVEPAPEAAPPKPRRKVRRGPILFVVIAAVVAAVVVQQGASSDHRGVASVTTLAAGDGVSVPPADVASSAWYCDEGTSSPKGRADETVIVASLASTRVVATVTVMPGGNGAPVSKTMHLAPREEVHVRVADILATPEPGVVVETVGGRAAVSHQLEHGDDFAVEPCSRSAGPDWYFAAGTTVEGSEHDLVLFNPFGDDAVVDITFLTDTGAQEPDGLQSVVVPRRSRITIAVQDSVLRQLRVATHVHARVGRIVAEHTQIFDGKVPSSGPTLKGIAVSLGAQSPEAVWRIAGGTTENSGIASLAVANFGATEARVAVHVVLVAGQKLAPQSVTVPAGGVIALDLTTRVPLNTDYAVTATARDANGRPVPIVAEMLASWSPTSSTPGVASTLGSTVAARRWVIPQPDVDADGFLTLLDPGADPVTAELLPAAFVDRPTGASSEPEVAVGPGTAEVLQITNIGHRLGGALVITANHPIVVGLTMLGPAGASVSAAIPDLSYAG